MSTALFLRGCCLPAAAPAFRRRPSRLVAVAAAAAPSSSSAGGDGVATTASTDAVLRGGVADGSPAAKGRGYGLVGGANGAIAPPPPATKSTTVETTIERVIFDFRFLALLAVAGSLAGSLLCFLNGCVYIKEAYSVYWSGCLKGVHTGQMVLKVVEAIDVYLAGTVMLIFGMGLYGLFISNTSTDVPSESDRALQGSSLFGMFALKERPKWMKITSLDELKTKVGHVIVMILLVKMFERSKMVKITTGLDLLSYSVCIFLSSASLYILHNLHRPEQEDSVMPNL
uniref:Structural constituent of ribosome n=1 Tax=Leersia perrieri TaxID=77586 RepID=A0A0D9X2D8_9ORYZ